MHSFRAVIAAAALAFASAAVQAQGTGSIEGRVVAARGREPLNGATVDVQGTNKSATSDAQGHYRIEGLTSGNVIVVVRHVGSEPARASVTIPSGGTITRDFALAENAIGLSAVVVTATRDEEKRTDIAANIGVVGGADIQTSKPHHSAEIVNRIPGVLNIDLGGEGSTVAMRLPINYSAVYGYLEDGVPIRSTGFFNHNALYEINVPGADRVEVFKGPASALYGSDAIGGVFNVLTRSPSLTPSTEIFVEGGAHGYQRTLVSASNTWGNDGIRGDLNVMHFGGWRDGANQVRQTGTLRWDHLMGSESRLKTLATFTNINSPGDGGSDIPQSDFDNSPSTNYTPIAERKVQAFRLSADYLTHSGSSSLDVTAYARYNRLQLLPFWQLTYDPQIWDAHNESLGLMVKGRREFTKGNAIAGVDFDYSPGMNTEDEIIPTSTPSFVFNSYTKGQRQYDYNVTFRGASPYAQVELNPVPALHLSAGVRFDALGYVYDNNLTQLDTGAHRRPANTSVSYTHLSPKLGLTYDLNSWANAFVSYRHGFRVPSEDQLFVQGSASNSVGLSPVKSDSYEAGIRTTGKQLAFELSAYSMDVDDDIVYFYNSTTFTSEVSNAGRTRHSGVEAGVKWALNDQWRVESSYSVVHHKYLEWVTATGSDFSGNQMEAGPREIGNSRITYSPVPASAISAEWSRVGKYFTDPDNLHTYDGYNVVNLEFSAPVFRSLSVVGRVANVTDARYSVATSFNPFVPAGQQERFTPGLPRTLYLGVQYKGSR